MAIIAALQSVSGTRRIKVDVDLWENNFAVVFSLSRFIIQWRDVFCFVCVCVLQLSEIQYFFQSHGPSKFLLFKMDLGVSKNRGTPKSSILIGFSIVNHPFWGTSICGCFPPICHWPIRDTEEKNCRNGAQVTWNCKKASSRTWLGFFRWGFRWKRYKPYSR